MVSARRRCGWSGPRPRRDCGRRAVPPPGAAAMSAAISPRRRRPRPLPTPAALQHLALGARASRPHALPADRSSWCSAPAAYFQLGQDEDPPFTFRAMAIRVFWPGATAQQVAEQVTDKLEKGAAGGAVRRQDPQLFEARRGADHVSGQGLVAAEGDAAVWYTVRKKIGDMRGTLPRGVSGRSSTTSSATSTARSTRSRPTASATPS